MLQPSPSSPTAPAPATPAPGAGAPLCAWTARSLSWVAPRTTTNNRMEMTAVLEALRAIHCHAGAVKLHDRLDLRHPGHQRLDPRLEAQRLEDERRQRCGEPRHLGSVDVVSERTRKHGKDSDIEWIAVPGHSGMPGNERCDEIAVDYSQGLVPALYHGPSAGYRIHLDADVPAGLHQEIQAPHQPRRLLRERGRQRHHAPQNLGGVRSAGQSTASAGSRKWRTPRTKPRCWRVGARTSH